MTTHPYTRFARIFGFFLILIGIVPIYQSAGFASVAIWSDIPNLEQGLLFFGSGLVLLGGLLIALPYLPLRVSADRAYTGFAIREQAQSMQGTWAIVALLFVGTLLRLYDLGAGLWYDEILTYVSYLSLPYGKIVTTFDSQNQHILYSLFSRTVFLVFGQSPWAARLPAVVFGVGSLGALYLLGRELSNRREAFLATALLTFSYHHIWFSQNARGYTGLLFFTLLSSWFLVRALREDRSRLWIFYALATSLGMYVHLTMLFATAGQFIIYLVQFIQRRNEPWPARWRGLFLGFGLGGLLTFQLYAIVLPQFFSGTLGEVSTVQSWINPLWAVWEIIRGLGVGYSSSAVAVIALLIFGIGLLSIARTNPLLVQLFTIPTLVCAFIVIGLGHHLWPRFFFFVAGFAVLIIVRGAMLVGEILSPRLRGLKLSAPQIGTVLASAIIVASMLSVPFVYGPKQDYGGALSFVESHKQPSDEVVVVGLAAYPYAAYYDLAWKEVQSLAELDAVRQATDGKVWLVYTLPMEMEAVHPDILQRVQSDFVLEKAFAGTLNGGTIYVYTTDNDQQTSSVQDRHVLNN